MSFVFTRVPGTKTQVNIESTSLQSAQNTLVIIAHKAATGGTASAYVPYSVQNAADPSLVVAELATQFGANSEISTMVVAAINAVLNSNLSTIAYPPIVVLPLAYADTSSSLNATLQAQLSLSAPFIASCYAGTDSAALTAVDGFVRAISGDSRGVNGQFGSFAFMGMIGSLSTCSAVATGEAYQGLLFPWLIDSAGTPANSVQKMAAATAAVSAANGLPFMPMTDVIVGGLVPPVAMSDWHTGGDSGTEALGLAAGLIPLMSGTNGKVTISRTVTSARRVSGTPDADYFDLQDWQVLYYLRLLAYNLAQQPQFKIAKASDATAKALLSAIIDQCKILEGSDFQMLQYVDKLLSQFAYTRSAQNRAAFIYTIPVNVVPIFANKGINIIGTNSFDVLVS